MRILVTGADQPLGEVAVRKLRREHDLRLTGREHRSAAGLDGLPYVAADLREPEQVVPLVEGVDAVAHLGVHATFITPDPVAEKEALDVAARGTFVLLQEALKAGVRRVVLASRLDLMMGAYPEEYRVHETWMPMPDATAASLAPFLAECTLREFARAEEIVGVCLRFGELGSDRADTNPEDAAAAIEKALTMELAGHGYRWWLYHIGSTDRYPLGSAARRPLLFTRGEGTHAGSE